MKTSIAHHVRKSAVLLFFILPAIHAFALRPVFNAGNDDTIHQDKTFTHDVTFGFFSLLNQHVSFGYEQNLKNQMNICTQLGIIGPGVNTDITGNEYYNNPKSLGAYISCGLKMFMHPDYLRQGMTRYNVMQGFYFMPEAVIGNFNYTYQVTSWNYPNNQTSTTVTDNITNYAVILNLGKQWVLSDRFILNIHVGIGYGGTTTKGNIPQSNYNSTDDLTGGNYFDYVTTNLFSYNAGVDMGMLF